MLVCIAGKNDIAVNVLDYLLVEAKKNKDLRLGCIFNKTETGYNGWQKSLKWYCEKYGVEILSVQEVYDIEEMIFLSLEFDKIIKPELFKTKQLYNIHFSMLPKYKGMYTSVWPILNGETETGVTFHFIDSGIDTGDIIDQEKITIEDDDTAYDVYRKYIKIGTDVVIRNMGRVLGNKEVNGIKQSNRYSSYYAKDTIDFSNVILDCKKTAWQIKKQIKAFCFRPYQLIRFENCPIFDIEILEEKSTFKAGMILANTKSYFKVATIDYDVLLLKDEFDNLLCNIQSFNNDEVKRILNNKSYINEKNEFGWTPLMVATYNNNKEIFYLLLEYGADIHEKNWNGTNLLMYAKDCFLNTNDCELFEYLSELGLSIDEQDLNDKSVVDYCLLNGIKRIGNVDVEK